jgi:cytochrome c-type biogenesis protein
MELTIAAALFAGIVSFLSPCVLPVVPAYLGQLGVVSVAAAGIVVSPTVGPPVQLAGARWRALPHALAFVLGFTIVFIVMGLTAYAFRPIFDLPLARQIGGIVLVILGLNLMGVLRIPFLSRTFRPAQPGFGEQPLGGAAARSPLAALALGSIFAIGWTPCVGPTLGAILGLSLTAGAAPQVVVLLTAFSLGLGIPFVAMALAMDGGRRWMQPFLRHGRTIELVGGGLVVLVGLAIFFDWLGWLAARFQFLWPQV